MKANEIQIGDWVYSTFSKLPCKVMYLKLHESGYTSVETTNVVGVKDIASLSPIPLTPEILEKNGFIEPEDEIFRIKTHRWERWLNNGYLHECVDILRSSDKKGYCIFARRDYNELKLYLNYVHELQHALRLCGITREIII